MSWHSDRRPDPTPINRQQQESLRCGAIHGGGDDCLDAARFPWRAIDPTLVLEFCHDAAPTEQERVSDETKRAEIDVALAAGDEVGKSLV